MSDLYDLNTADSQMNREVIPAGTLARVRMTIKPGNAGPGGWLTRSRTSDAVYINAEFVVMAGPHAKRKFWQNLTVDGGKLDDKGRSIAGNISRATLRAILESARGIKPVDTSPQAVEARKVPGFEAFDGIEFAAKIGVEPAKDQYQAKNFLDLVITPDKPTWSELMQQPSGAGPAQAPAPTASMPAAAAQASKAPTAGQPAWLR